MKYARIDYVDSVHISIYPLCKGVVIAVTMPYFSRLQPLYYAISLNKSFDLMQVYHFA